MNTRYLIMAQGGQERLPTLGYSKCLIPIGDEPLLSRTLRLLAELDSSVTPGSVSVIGREELRRTCQNAAELVTLTTPGKCILDGIAQTRPLWGNARTTILLGDVLFSRAVMAAIVEQSHYADCAPGFWGTADLSASGGELFAMSFHRSWYENMQLLLNSAPCRRTNPTRSQPGHLRNLMLAVQGLLGWKAGDPEPYWHPALMAVVDDFTTDFDTPTDLAEMPRVIDAMLRLV